MSRVQSGKRTLWAVAVPGYVAATRAEGGGRMGGGGDWVRRLGRGPNGRAGALIALILLSAALALPALPVHADATRDLFEAATAGTVSEVKAALAAGADPGARNDGGFTPFDYAKENEALKGTDAY